MANLALLLCLIFVALALKNDKKEFPRFSRALWLPLLWIGQISSRPLSSWLFPRPMVESRSVSEYLQGNPMERAILITFIIFGLLVLMKRRDRFSVPFKDNRWLIILYVFTLLSIGWSAFPNVTVKRMVKVAGDITMAMILLTEVEHKAAIEHVLRRVFIILISFSITLAKFFPLLGIFYTYYGGRSWIGVTTGKNELGVLCAFSAVFLVWRILKTLPKRNVYDLALLFLSLYLLKGAQSMTAIMIFLMGAGLLGIMAVFKNNPALGKKAIVFMIVIAAVLQVLLTAFLNTSVTGLFGAPSHRPAKAATGIRLW